MRALRPVLSALIALSATASARANSFDGSKTHDPSPQSGVLAPAIGPISAPDGRMWIVVEAAGRDERAQIAGAGVAIEEVDGETVSGVASPNALKRLLSMGVRIKSQTPLTQYEKDFPAADGAYRDFAPHPSIARLHRVRE